MGKTITEIVSPVILAIKNLQKNKLWKNQQL